jgi:site-specific recombinase XerD
MKQRDHLKMVGTDFQPAEAKSSLPEKDSELLANIVDAYITRRVGALRHRESSVKGDLNQVYDLVAFSGKAPWMWSEEDFEQWCAVLGVEKRVGVPTQRKYQNAIRTFLDYLVDNVKFRNEIHQRYGLFPVQVCHPDNCIPHVVERELTAERQPLSHDQITILFDAIDEAIREAGRFGSKNFRPLQRDKAMFFTVYAAGTRASETLGINLGSFYPNPHFPEFEEFGTISVWGKGANGSGPKHRMVPVTHALLPEVLRWYIKNVRPFFLKNADANETALFLSERGTRLKISSFENRFQRVLDLAGLGAEGFTPHCLRHSSVTHESLRFSTEAVRIKHGHAYSSTTQGYNHTPDDFVRDEINRGIASHLDAILKDE